MVEPLTAAVIVSLFFSEAFKEGGKALGKGVADKFTELANIIREKFRAEGTEGLLTRAQNQPTQENKANLQEELQTQMDDDEAFANKLKELVEQLKAQAPGIRQVALSEIEVSGDLKAGDISQEATHGSSVDQEMLRGVNAQNIDVGNLEQKA